MTAALHETVPIHPIQEQLPRDAAEHMDRLNGEMLTEDFSAGWDQLQKPGSKFNDDSVYAYHDAETGNAVFAVFDGVGGQERGDAASGAARQGLHDFLLDNAGTAVGNPEDALNTAFTLMNRQAREDAPVSATTALVGILYNGVGDKAGKKYLAVGAAGDSLGYIIRKDGSVEELNREETLAREVADDNRQEIEDAKREGRKPELEEIPSTYGTYISNSLGSSKRGENAFTGLHEVRDVEVEDGDIVVLTTDGITGDNDNQRMAGESNEATIRWIARDMSLTPRQRAQKMIEYANKNDDRTAVVVEVGGQNSAEADATVPRGWQRASVAPAAGNLAVVH